MGGVEERMRPDFLEAVATGQVEDQRGGGPVGAEMQVARDQRAVPGDVDVLEAVRCQGDHLVIAAADAGIEIAFLVVGLENHVLGAAIQGGGLEVEVQRRLWMAGVLAPLPENGRLCRSPGSGNPASIADYPAPEALCRVRSSLHVPCV